MSSKTKLKVLFFAKARELLKISESEITVPSVIDSAQALYQALEDKWPELAKLNRTFALALNEEYLSQDQEPGVCKGCDFFVGSKVYFIYYLSFNGESMAGSVI